MPISIFHSIVGSYCPANLIFQKKLAIARDLYKAIQRVDWPSIIDFLPQLDTDYAFIKGSRKNHHATLLEQVKQLYKNHPPKQNTEINNLLKEIGVVALIVIARPLFGRSNPEIDLLLA